MNASKCGKGGTSISSESDGGGGKFWGEPKGGEEQASGEERVGVSFKFGKQKQIGYLASIHTFVALNLMISAHFLFPCSFFSCRDIFHWVWLVWLGLWCSTPLSTIFKFYRGGLLFFVVVGGNWSTRRKPPTWRKSLKT